MLTYILQLSDISTTHSVDSLAQISTIPTHSSIQKSSTDIIGAATGSQYVVPSDTNQVASSSAPISASPPPNPVLSSSPFPTMSTSSSSSFQGLSTTLSPLLSTHLMSESPSKKFLSTSISPITITTSTTTTPTTTSTSTTTTTTAIHPVTVADWPIKHGQIDKQISHHHHPHNRWGLRLDRLATIDLIIVVVYICLLLSTSISTMLRVRKSRKRHAQKMGVKAGAQASSLMGSRKMNWFTVGASIFAANLGSEHFIGLSGSAAANGFSVAAYELNALILLQLSTWVFIPVLIVSKINTMPEYFEKRFGGKRIRTYLAMLSIILYILTKISVNLYSGGIFIQQAIGWNLYTSAMFILALTSIMTLTGGVKGAMVIDNLQAVVMTIGASIVSAKALIAIGGWEGLKNKYPMAIPSKVPTNLTHCAEPNPRAFQMLRPVDDPDMPWLGFILGQTWPSFWYWCADQMMVQRFLSARSLAHAQGSAVFAGYLKVAPLIFMVIPGMISRCLFTDEISCIDPDECLKFCQSSVSCSNTAYPRLVLELMPMGARGMLVAAMVAALMNDLCNVFASASALFSCDIWPIFRSRASPKEQETVGRLFVLVLVLASIMWIPVIQEMQGGQLFIYIQAVASLFVPPIAAVYVSAVLWCRTNETGAFWGMMTGFNLGILRLVLSFMYKEPSCGQTTDERPWLLRLHFMYYSAFLFASSSLATNLISRMTRPPAPFRLIRTTFWTRFDTQIRRDDKNVFEMKYTGKTMTNSSSSNLLIQPGSTSNSKSSDVENGAQASGQLFTIDHNGDSQQQHALAPSPDLSSVIVDISKEPSKDSNTVKSTKPTLGRSILTHQGSLSDAGKLIANRLVTEGVKAKEIVIAAASHLKAQHSSIKFQNLRADDDDGEVEDDNDEDEDEIENDDDDDDDDDYKNQNEEESTNLDGEDEEDDEDDDQLGSRIHLQPQKKFSLTRNHSKTAKSSLSVALASYRFKPKFRSSGYHKAYAFDEEDEEDESSSLRRPKARNGLDISAGDESSTDDARNTPTTTTTDGTTSLISRGSSSSDTRLIASSGSRNKKHKLTGKTVPAIGKQQSKGQVDSTNAGLVGPKSAGRRSMKRRSKSKLKAKSGSVSGSKGKIEYEEPDDDGSVDNRNYRCLDNTVSLLLKTPLEEMVLRIAMITIIVMTIGLYIVLSLPP